LGTPVFTNYVPVIDHPLYYAGLLIFAAGLLVYLASLVPAFISALRNESRFKGESYGMAVAGFGVFLACACYLLAYITFPDDLKKFVYLEHFFWGGGHILQFVNAAGMLVAWMLLTRFTLDTVSVDDKRAAIVFSLLLLFMLPAPLFYFLFQGGDDSFKLAFTRLMQFGYIATVLVIGAGVIKAIASSMTGDSFGKKLKSLPWEKPGFSALVFSLLLFAAGGIFALFIRGSNTKIPSHYHGVIGAVTISFMGLTYYVLPLIRREIKTPKAARLQPYIYGVGQLLFALGLFWAGGHGVARKTYGATQGLDSVMKQASMMLMGLGGLIAIIGGATFVYIVLRSLLGGRDKSKDGLIL
jgi:heme/copper-type cytochrome/quinol oxidase subunit 1